MKKRYEMIDAVRGLALISMVFYHFCYDVFVMYSKNPDWIRTMPAIVWERAICVSFILVAGLSAGFSRSLWKRGLLLNGIGMLITIVTGFIAPESIIIFGILNLLGCCLLLLIPIRTLIRQNNWKIWSVLSLVLFFFFRKIETGILGFGSWKAILLPESWKAKAYLIPFGIHGSTFFSSDYFPIFPWFFLFLLGYTFFYAIQEGKRRKEILSISVPVFSRAGKYSLIVYLLHQPLLLVLCRILLK
jgi:uncharacterized membrane protein